MTNPGKWAAPARVALIINRLPLSMVPIQTTPFYCTYSSAVRNKTDFEIAKYLVGRGCISRKLEFARQRPDGSDLSGGGLNSLGNASPRIVIQVKFKIYGLSLQCAGLAEALSPSPGFRQYEHGVNGIDPDNNVLKGKSYNASNTKC